MRIASLPLLVFAIVATVAIAVAVARPVNSQELIEVGARFQAPLSHAKGETRNAVDRPPAVIWLTPLDSGHTPAPDRSRKYTLLQKNKEFTPHVLVVPVGSVVEFPNADPFFHNVFSLFDGRRFDLGLYEAGSTRGVTFGKEGISYIFCNIHPEMSAVVIALSTPFYAVEDKQGGFRIPDVPADEYVLQVWVQGADPAELKALSHKVHIAPGHADLGTITLSQAPHPPSSHTNKYGKAYDTREPSVY
jgi:plastocyanin